MTEIITQETPETRPPPRHPRRWPWIAAGAVVAAGCTAAFALTTLGGHSATMRGTLTVTTWGGDSAFCDSTSGKDPGSGAQVSVTSPSGDVVGTGELGANPETSTQTLIGCAEEVTVYKFTVAGLPGEPRYGVLVSGLNGTIWFKPAELSRADISVGG
jgi:hypothetical protein